MHSPGSQGMLRCQCVLYWNSCNGCEMVLNYAIAPLLSTAQECSIIFIRIYVCSSFPVTLHEEDDDNRLERMNGRMSAVVEDREQHVVIVGAVEEWVGRRNL